MTCWFTGDTHFSHANVLKYTKRPFTSADEMDEALIERWNAVVRPGDSVYHLGDVALCRPPHAVELVRRLNGQKFLVLGNHDKATRHNKPFLELWVWVRELTEIKIGDQPIVLCHYAMRVWNRSHYGAWQLHGHSHGSLTDDPHARQLDVGVDCWDCQPVAFETLQTRMALKDWRPIDHHGRQETADGPIDVEEMRGLSDSDVCQACGARWENHGCTCVGSAP